MPIASNRLLDGGDNDAIPSASRKYTHTTRPSRVRTARPAVGESGAIP